MEALSPPERYARKIVAEHAAGLTESERIGLASAIEAALTEWGQTVHSVVLTMNTLKQS